MPDTDDNLEPSAAGAPEAGATAASAAPEPRPAEARAVDTGDLKDTGDILSQSFAKLSGEAAPAEQEASPTSTQADGQEPTDADAPAAPAAADGEPTDKAGESADGAAEQEELTEQERSALAPKVRRRIDRLLRERASLKPHAEAYRNIAAFMAENSLSSEETARGFDFMARVKQGDAKGALEIIEPVYRQLLLSTGRELPDDIKAKVDQGYVDEDTAAELARTRAAAAAAEQRARLENERRTAAQAATHQGSIRDALNSWSDAKATDPDFAAVGTHMVRLLKNEFAANPPRDARDAVRRADEMFAILRGRGGAAAATPTAPRMPATPPGPTSNMSTARQPTRQPRDMNEVFAVAFDRAYRKLGVA